MVSDVEEEPNTLEDLKAERNAIMRQLASLKDLNDKHSKGARLTLSESLKKVNHSITECKPLPQQKKILEDALAKRKQELEAAKLKKIDIMNTIADLTVDINQLDSKLAKINNKPEDAEE
eukprot:5595261-Karenia_brevis.AAC.1